MGLGPDVLHAQPAARDRAHLRLGQSGPFRDRPGFGSLIEAFSGFAAMNGHPDRPPVLPAFPVADAYAGLYGAMAALTALRVVETHGGQVVDLALLEPILAMLGPKAAEYQLRGRPSRRDRDDRGGFHRRAHAGRQPRLFEVAEVTVGQVCDEKDLVEHPYVHEREVLVHMRGDVGGSLPMHNIVPRLSATPGAIRAPSPALGEHNVEILQGLGCTPEEIRALIGAGVLDMAAEGEAEGKRPS